MKQPVSFGQTRSTSSISLRVRPRTDVESRPPSLPAPPIALAQLTGLARALANESPPVDDAKIAQIRKAAASGDYPVDTRAIANAMLHHFAWMDA